MEDTCVFFAGLLAVYVIIGIVRVAFYAREERRELEYWIRVGGVRVINEPLIIDPPRPPRPRVKGDTTTGRPYPRRVKGATAAESRKARLYVQRSGEGSALYEAATKAGKDRLPWLVLADWLEERGFPGAAADMRRGRQ